MSAQHAKASHDFLKSKAREKGCDVRFASENVLQLDFDHRTPMIDLRVLELIHDNYHIEELIGWPSSSGQGHHYELVLEKDVPLVARIALQAALGSDPVREALGVIEAGQDINNVCLFRPSKS